MNISSTELKEIFFGLALFAIYQIAMALWKNGHSDSPKQNPQMKW